MALVLVFFFFDFLTPFSSEGKWKGRKTVTTYAIESIYCGNIALKRYYTLWREQQNAMSRDAEAKKQIACQRLTRTTWTVRGRPSGEKTGLMDPERCRNPREKQIGATDSTAEEQLGREQAAAA